MTPEKFEKMVKDYSENGLPEGSALICLHGGMERNFGFIYGRSRELAATLALMMSKSENFAELVMLAWSVYNNNDASMKKAEAADRIAKDFLRNNGFKMEGE